MPTVRECVVWRIVSTVALLSAHWALLLQSSTAFGAEREAVDAEIAQVAKLYGLLDTPAAQRPKNFDERIAAFVDERDRIGRFLKQKGVVATREAIDRRLESVERVLAREGKTLGEALAAAEIKETELRRALSVPVAWNQYLRLVLTDASIEREFDENRDHYDGTTLQLAQVFLVRRGVVIAIASSGPPNDGSESQREAEEIHTAIVSGEMSFEDAVAKRSESPSASDGGRMGPVRYRGDVPNEVATWAFTAKIGDVSSPIATPFGYHIVKVLSRNGGDRSLEDARTEVIAVLSDRLWADALASKRRSTTR